MQLVDTASCPGRMLTWRFATSAPHFIGEMRFRGDADYLLSGAVRSLSLLKVKFKLSIRTIQDGHMLCACYFSSR